MIFLSLILFITSNVSFSNNVNNNSVNYDKIMSLKESIKIETNTIADIESRLIDLDKYISNKRIIIKHRLYFLFKRSTPKGFSFLTKPSFVEDSLLKHFIKQDLKTYNQYEVELKSLNELRVIFSNEKNKLEDQLRELEKSEEVVRDDVPSFDDIKKTESKLFDIKFQEPVKGKIKSNFGKQWNIVSKNWAYNRGIKISCEYGTQVLPVLDGVVKYTGWIQGLGKVVIIEHSENILSTYAYLSRITVSIGQNIKKSDVVGYVADSKVENDTFLYLEIKVAGKNINPTLVLNYK